ncbi:MAG: hypothetical protein KKE20_00135 [Nanoarchaeota archaeon]|nr:hypothetical protein [Nanoarchaeota archaeon]
MKHLTFSTANLSAKIPPYDIDRILSLITPLGLDIDGVMLCLWDYTDLSIMKISDSSFDIMKKMNFNSIHAPVADFRDDAETRKLLDDIKELYDRIGAKQVVLHPYRIKDFSIIKNSGMNCVIEFMRPHKGLEIDYYSRILEENDHLGFSHDLSHAAQFSNEMITEVFDRFRKRIRQVHVSFADKETRHRPMFYATPEFLKAADCVRHIDAEFVIESMMTEPEEIKKECAFCRKWLSKGAKEA